MHWERAGEGWIMTARQVCERDTRKTSLLALNCLDMFCSEDLKNLPTAVGRIPKTILETLVVERT